MASLAFAANAVTNMCVKTADGKVVKYDVENVAEVYYEETTETPTDQGVTVSGKEGIYTYVDLGLESGTKWATYNVGATKPTEYGDYFAWGETKPKEDYSWETYKWCNGDETSLTKYNTKSDYGTVDNKKVLDAEDDAATANWGSAWRMPTPVEQRELLEGCDWEWVVDFNGSGVNGQLGTSKKNGNTIFLPAAELSGFEGFAASSYCSSLLDEDMPYYVYQLSSTCYLDYSYSDHNYFGCNDNGYRDRAHSVRAVLR